MGVIFNDDLSPVRQKLYWALFRDCVTIDEWEYASLQAMARETFHKMPLPGQLLDYVREYRRVQRDNVRCADGVLTRKPQLELRDSLVDPAELDALIASVWPEEHAAPKYPRVPTNRHLTAEELHYAPQRDAEVAKQKARDQLRQLRDEERA